MSWRTPRALRSVSHGHHRAARLRRASRCARRAARREGPGGPRPSPAGPASRRCAPPDGVRRPGGLTAAHWSPETNGRRSDDAARTRRADSCRARGALCWTQPDGSTSASGEVPHRSQLRPVGFQSQARSHLVVAQDPQPPPGDRPLTPRRNPRDHDRDPTARGRAPPCAASCHGSAIPLKVSSATTPAHSGTPWCGGDLRRLETPARSVALGPGSRRRVDAALANATVCRVVGFESRAGLGRRKRRTSRGARGARGVRAAGGTGSGDGGAEPGANWGVGGNAAGTTE